MTNILHAYASPVVGFLFISMAATTSASDALLTPANQVIDQSLPAARALSMGRAAQTYYTFWNTGDPNLAEQAVAKSFLDLNLPEGRPQGPSGPVLASKKFREAIPDLSVSVEDMYIVGNYVIGRLHFRGHFTGHFNNTKGDGQIIDFSAVDIYQIEDGKIITNWHLEDNLTLLKQMGVVQL